MLEIGEKLKAERESIGISIEEVAEDLKLRPSQIVHIEEGNMEAFQDIFYLKYFIRDYSKYLGLDYSEMVDEFNEFLFDYTSKISLEDIKEAKKLYKKNENTKKISSPYTLEHKKQFNLAPIILIILIITLVVALIFVFSSNEKDDFINNNVVYKIKNGVDYNEFA